MELKKIIPGYFKYVFGLIIPPKIKKQAKKYFKKSDVFNYIVLVGLLIYLIRMVVEILKE